MKIVLSLVFLTFVLATSAQRAENYTRYVNPLIGTQKMGHTFPGATVPFGAVQLSPDTDQQPHNIGGGYNKDATSIAPGISTTTRASSASRTRISAVPGIAISAIF